MQSFFEFLVSVINHYHINGFHLFWDSFERVCFQINSDKIFFPLLSKALWSSINSGYIVYYFQIWNKKDVRLWSRWLGFYPRSSHTRDLKKWYLMLPFLTLSIRMYASRVKWSNPGNGVSTSPTPRFSSYWKGTLEVTLDCGRQLYLLISSRVISNHMDPMYIETSYT